MIKDITVVETNYTDYALVLKHQAFNREYTQVALYGETQTHVHIFYVTSKCELQLHCTVNHVYHHSACLCVFLYLCAGRSQRLRTDIIQKFKAFAQSQGFPKDSILTLPPAGKGEGIQYTVYTNSHKDNCDK